MFTALRAMIRDPEGKVIVVWALAQVLLGTLMYQWLEDWSVVDSMYFSVVTLATVGYGDLHPTTTAAKLFTILYIVSGLGILAAFISELTKQRAATIARLRHRADTLDHDADPGAPSTRPTASDDDQT